MSKTAWKTHDLYDLFRSIQRGNIPLKIPHNSDCEEFDHSYKLDPVYPWCIPNDQEAEMKISQIETAVPVPRKLKPERQADSIAIHETLSKLEPTQSVFFEFKDSELKYFTNLISSIRAKFNDKLFITRTSKGIPFGIRVWRMQ